MDGFGVDHVVVVEDNGDLSREIDEFVDEGTQHGLHAQRLRREAHSRISPRGEGFSSLVYWLLMSLFLLASVAMVYFFWLVVRDQWIHDRLLVAGRFYEGETLQVIFALLVSVSVPSGLLWRHHKRIDSYGSPLEPLFMAVCTLCAALAAVTLLPALFAS
jgi:magnesium-transporting ATPase (P-type)